jgi:8-amino-7-oxononanoate synthase
VYHKKLQLSTTEVTAPYGSTGSRLLAGNYSLIEEVEQELASFHQSAAAIIYNSGYDANVGLLSCVPQKVILFCTIIFAMLQLEMAFVCRLQMLFLLLTMIFQIYKKITNATGNIFIVTESVFSMDGDFATYHNWFN